MYFPNLQIWFVSDDVVGKSLCHYLYYKIYKVLYLVYSVNSSLKQFYAITNLYNQYNKNYLIAKTQDQQQAQLYHSKYFS